SELTRRADYCAMMCKEPVLTKRGLVSRQNCESMCNEQGAGTPPPIGPAPTGSYIFEKPSGSETVVTTTTTDEPNSAPIVIENGSKGVETLAVSSASDIKGSASATDSAEATDEASGSGATAALPACHYLVATSLVIFMSLVPLGYMGS
ncbi:hypothetical protein H4R35_003016, partial [Dimargaris xerosporica]